MGALVAFICTMLGWSSKGTNTTKTIRTMTMETGMHEGRHQMLRFFLLLTNRNNTIYLNKILDILAKFMPLGRFVNLYQTPHIYKKSPLIWSFA